MSASKDNINDASNAFPLHRRILHAWNHSLRFRLLWLGLMPLLMVFPIVLLSLGIFGSIHISQLVKGQLNSNLSGAENYLRVVQSELKFRVADFVQSDLLSTLVLKKSSKREIDETLTATLRGSGFDFLLIVDRQGVVLGSSSSGAEGELAPDSFVIRQAQIGVVSSGFEQFSIDQLLPLAPHKIKQLSALYADSGAKLTLINAAAHFPLSVAEQDAILLGGVFINDNSVLIEHMREIIYPAGKLPAQAEGFVGIFAGDKSIINSRLKTLGSNSAQLYSARTSSGNANAQLNAAQSNAYETQKFGNINFGLALSPIVNGDNKTIATLVVGFPLGPYTSTAWVMLGIVSGMLGMTMLIISVIYLNAGRGIVTKIKTIIDVITVFGQGNRLSRLTNIQRRDELGELAKNVNTLLDTITRQESEQIAAQQLISDEASRRRAIFSSVLDGVMILNEKGQVLEANPKIYTMLGYLSDEMTQINVSQWDTHFSSGHFIETLNALTQDSPVFESLHRRKDGSYYPAEVSISHADWAGKKFILMLIRDISLRKMQEDKLKISASVFTSALEAIVLTNPETVITDVNEAYTKIIGYEKEEVVGKNARAIGFIDSTGHLFDHILSSLRGVGFWAGELELTHKNKKTIPVQLNVSAVHSDDGTIQHFVAIFSDISLQKQQQLRLEQLALHDSLTLLPNRQKLSERLALAMANSQRSRHYGALMMLDLDNFKPLNDKHGHAAGDQLLKDVAQRLKSCVREVDTVARLGGDEFVILLEALSDDVSSAAQHTLQIAEKIRVAIAQPYLVKSGDPDEDARGLHHTCTASIGISLFSGKALSQNQLLNRADQAMYEAKATGRNHIIFSQE